MWQRILDTEGDRSLILLRLTLAAAIFPHGAQKALGWFGGAGFAGSMSYFTDTLGIPAPFALLVILGELLGPIGLAVGFLSRIAAFGIGAIMTGALVLHLPNGFFMNWFGNQAGEGFEYHLLAIGLSLAILIKGSGAHSLDRRIATT